MKDGYFPEISIPGAIVNDLQRRNPWWEAKPHQILPPMRRWAFDLGMSRLKGGLAKAIILTGPRQVGKSTLALQMVDQLLDEGVPPSHICYIQFDELPAAATIEEPILRLVEWYEKNILQRTLNEAAQQGQQAYLFLDEVQNLTDWAPQIKFLADTSDVRILITGSSALRIEAGRDSLAGRIQTLELGPLFLREIAELRHLGTISPYFPTNGLTALKDKGFWLDLRAYGEQHRPLRHQAFQAFSERGSYPVAQARSEMPWEELMDHLVGTVIKRAINHDLRMGPKGAKRDEHLLEEVFRLSCRYIGQAPKSAVYVDEIKRALSGNIGWQRILTYLKFLDGTLLMRLIEPLELRLKRARGPSKLCLCDHVLRAAWLQEIVPLDAAGLERHPHLRDLAGHIAESAAGYFLRSLANLDVAHFPERATEPEVDYILTIGEQRIPVEVKYRQRIDFSDTLGLRKFMEKAVYNAPFSILVTMNDEQATDDPRIVSLPLSTLLLMR